MSTPMNSNEQVNRRASADGHVEQRLNPRKRPLESTSNSESFQNHHHHHHHPLLSPSAAPQPSPISSFASTSSHCPVPSARPSTRRSTFLDHIYGKHFSLKPYRCTWPGCTVTSCGFLTRMVSHVKQAHHQAENFWRYIRRDPVGPLTASTASTSTLTSASASTSSSLALASTSSVAVAASPPQPRTRGRPTTAPNDRRHRPLTASSAYLAARSTDYLYCPICEKRLRKSHLTDHLNAVHLRRHRYQCAWPGCAEDFGYRENCQKHLRQAHQSTAYERYLQSIFLIQRFGIFKPEEEKLTHTHHFARMSRLTNPVEELVRRTAHRETFRNVAHQLQCLKRRYNVLYGETTDTSSSNQVERVSIQQNNHHHHPNSRAFILRKLKYALRTQYEACFPLPPPDRCTVLLLFDTNEEAFFEIRLKPKAWPVDWPTRFDCGSAGIDVELYSLAIYMKVLEALREEGGENVGMGVFSEPPRTFGVVSSSCTGARSQSSVVEENGLARVIVKSEEEEIVIGDEEEEEAENNVHANEQVNRRPSADGHVSKSAQQQEEMEETEENVMDYNNILQGEDLAERPREESSSIPSSANSTVNNNNNNNNNASNESNNNNGSQLPFLSTIKQEPTEHNSSSTSLITRKRPLESTSSSAFQNHHPLPSISAAPKQSINSSASTSQLAQLTSTSTSASSSTSTTTTTTTSNQPGWARARAEAFLCSADYTAASPATKLSCPVCSSEYQKVYLMDHIYGKHFSLKPYRCTWPGCTTGTSCGFLTRMVSHVQQAHHQAENPWRYIRRDPVGPLTASVSASSSLASASTLASSSFSSSTSSEVVAGRTQRLRASEGSRASTASASASTTPRLQSSRNSPAEMTAAADRFYASSAYLAAHIRDFLNCPMCGRRLQKNSLTDHINALHLRRRLYHCAWPGCTEAFGHRTASRSHLKHVHNATDYERYLHYHFPSRMSRRTNWAEELLRRTAHQETFRNVAHQLQCLKRRFNVLYGVTADTASRSNQIEQPNSRAFILRKLKYALRTQYEDCFPLPSPDRCTVLLLFDSNEEAFFEIRLKPKAWPEDWPTRLDWGSTGNYVELLSGAIYEKVLEAFKEEGGGMGVEEPPRALGVVSRSGGGGGGGPRSSVVEENGLRRVIVKSEEEEIVIGDEEEEEENNVQTNEQVNRRASDDGQVVWNNSDLQQQQQHQQEEIEETEEEAMDHNMLQGEDLAKRPREGSSTIPSSSTDNNNNNNASNGSNDNSSGNQLPFSNTFKQEPTEHNSSSISLITTRKRPLESTSISALQNPLPLPPSAAAAAVRAPQTMARDRALPAAFASAFASSSHLQSAAITSCPVRCARGLITKRFMTDHLNVVHLGRRYHCAWPGCAKAFSYRHIGHKHLRQAHKSTAYEQYLQCRE
ncbi:hypothetical protein TYRP_001533 [Tyrophagus putrescentiae]|nr:hypothetical protein TYRP_001533 [Tyrophagus putrescentiae]